MSQSRETPPAFFSIDDTLNLADPDLMLKCAIAYIDKGWRVFPLHNISPSGQCSCRATNCRRKGNHPIRPAGIRGATTRLCDILDWWDDDPDANIGLVTGSGLVVISVCPERQGSLDALPIKPIPQTGLVSTGEGGWHLYFTYKKLLLMNSQPDALGPGIDIKAEGSYVIAPPSLHPSGQRYTWTSHIAPRSLPPKILTLLQPERGWMYTDYRQVLDLMNRRGYPLTPGEISQNLHRDYSATLKLLHRMIIDHYVYQSGRGLYCPTPLDSSPTPASPVQNNRTDIR